MSWLRSWAPVIFPAIFALLMVVVFSTTSGNATGTVFLRPPGCIAVQMAGAVTTPVEPECRLQAHADVRWYGFTSLRLENKKSLRINSSEVLAIVHQR